jgi:hypothetical protein
MGIKHQRLLSTTSSRFSCERVSLCIRSFVPFTVVHLHRYECSGCSSCWHVECGKHTDWLINSNAELSTYFVLPGQIPSAIFLNSNSEPITSYKGAPTAHHESSDDSSRNGDREKMGSSPLQEQYRNHRRQQVRRVTQYDCSGLS